MHGFAFFCAVWALLVAAHVLWVVGAVPVSFLGGPRPTAVSICHGPKLVRRRIGGIEWTLKLLPIGASISYRPLSGDSNDDPFRHTSGFTRAALALATWVLPLTVAVLLLGPAQTAHHLGSLFVALIEPSRLPERIARYRALLAEGSFATAFGVLLAKATAINLLPFPAAVGQVVLRAPFERSMPEVARLIAIGSAVLFLLWAIPFALLAVSAGAR